MTFVHMHDGETVYYDDACFVCETLESEGKSTNAVQPSPVPMDGVRADFQFGALIGILRASGTSEADLRAMFEFALIMCKGVK